VLGGAGALQVSTLDEAYGRSDETTRRIACNTQIMLQEEFNLLEPADPAGGSWYVESLTLCDCPRGVG
jgi:methylmalonyl-CoA mutase